VGPAKWNIMMVLGAFAAAAAAAAAALPAGCRQQLVHRLADV
jgi:hypothetical protein